MTIIVEPSKQRGVANAHTIAAVVRWGDSDWIVGADTDVNATRAGLSTPPLNAAAVTNPSGLDVKIDTFEAFIGGAYVASDDATVAEHTHTLAGASTTTTLYLGWDISAADTIIFGPVSDFAATDPKVPVADVVDDGSTVTTILDRRPVGKTRAYGTLLASTYDDDATTGLSLDTGALSETYPVYYVVIYREDQASSAEDYMNMRVNGSASGNYYADFYDSTQNTSSSYDGTTEWQKIAGVGTDASTTYSYGGFAYQVLRVMCPPVIVSHGDHYPLLDTVHVGVGKNHDYNQEGVFAVDSAAVDQINVFGGANSTGFIEIYGAGMTMGT